MALSENGAKQQPWIGQPFSAIEEVPTFRVKKIDNGFLVMYAKHEGEMHSHRYVPHASELGDCITAILVEMKLEN